MEKQTILNEFSSFLDEMKVKHRLPDSGGTIHGLLNRFKSFNIEDINRDLTDKVNELLSKTKESEIEEVKTDLIEQTRNFLMRLIKGD